MLGAGTRLDGCRVLESDPCEPERFGPAIRKAVRCRRFESNAVARFQDEGFKPEIESQFAGDDEAILAAGVMMHLFPRSGARLVDHLEEFDWFVLIRRQPLPGNAARQFDCSTFG